MQDIIDSFLRQNVYIVAGSFRNEKKYAYIVYNKLNGMGKKVYPINPKGGEVAGEKCYKSVGEIPEEADAASLVTPPSVTVNIVKECAEKGVKVIWMQPGAECGEAIEYCKKNDIGVIYDTCLMLQTP